MRHIEDDCVYCGLPCCSSCRYKKVVRYYCDQCEDEAPLYRFNDMDLCEHCVLEMLEKVEESWN